jgi:transcriptional regulator with XRE-family HTH domain
MLIPKITVGSLSHSQAILKMRCLGGTRCACQNEVFHKVITTTDWLPATFSKVLHKRREALGISQEELSKRSGLHRTYISDVERGARNVSLKNMGRLSVALEVTPSILMRWAELIYANEHVDFSNNAIRELRPELVTRTAHGAEHQVVLMDKSEACCAANEVS